MTMKLTYQIISLLMTSLITVIFTGCKKDNITSVDEPVLEVIADNLQFAEGPAYLNGDLYFSDIQANKIYLWNKNSGLQVFIENSAGANGLCFDNSRNLIVCQGAAKRIVSVNANREITVITDKFGKSAYNEPNDVWVSPSGNIYFTDPVFTCTLSQPGEYVYCVLASSGNVIKVIDDLVKPNGIIGNIAGTMLFVADYGASKIYQYSVYSDGTLSGKQLFAEIKADGLSIDSEGNIYAASTDLMIFNPIGQITKAIQIPGTITNICIVEGIEKTAFITTHNAVYKQIIY
jgi:gluconolactonase